MGVVYLFLVLLNLAISLLTYFTREHTLLEEATLVEEERARRQKKKKRIIKTEDCGINTAVIAAALHAYRNA